MENDSIKMEENEILIDENDDIVNHDETFTGDMLPLSMCQGTIDEMKKLSIAPSHLVSYLKTEHQQMTQRESQKSSQRNTTNIFH